MTQTILGTETNEYLGLHLAIDSGKIAISSYGAQGSTRIYEKSVSWTETSIVADVTSGWGSMDLSGSKIAFSKNQSVNIYEYINNGWILSQILSPSHMLDNEFNSNFGEAIALEGENLVVGAQSKRINSMEEERRGAAYLYKNINGVFTEVQYLYLDHNENGSYGRSVDLNNGRVVIADQMRNNLGVIDFLFNF